MGYVTSMLFQKTYYFINTAISKIYTYHKIRILCNNLVAYVLTKNEGFDFKDFSLRNTVLEVRVILIVLFVKKKISFYKVYRIN